MLTLANNASRTISSVWPAGLATTSLVGAPVAVQTGAAQLEPPPGSILGAQGGLTTELGTDLARLLDLPSGTHDWQPEPVRPRRAKPGEASAPGEAARALAQLNKNVFKVAQWILRNRTPEEWAARGVTKDSMMSGLVSYSDECRQALAQGAGVALAGKPAVPTPDLLFHMAFMNAQMTPAAPALTTEAGTTAPVDTAVAVAVAAGDTTDITAAPVLPKSSLNLAKQQEMLRVLAYFMKRADVLLPQFRRRWVDMEQLSLGKVDFQSVDQAALACPPASMLHPDKKHPGRFTAVYPHLGQAGQAVTEIYIGRKPAIVAHGEEPHSVRVSRDGGKSWQTPSVYTDDHIVVTQLQGWQKIMRHAATMAEFWKKQSLWMPWRR